MILKIKKNSTGEIKYYADDKQISSKQFLIIKQVKKVNMLKAGSGEDLVPGILLGSSEISIEHGDKTINVDDQLVCALKNDQLENYKSSEGYFIPSIVTVISIVNNDSVIVEDILKKRYEINIKESEPILAGRQKAYEKMISNAFSFIKNNQPNPTPDRDHEQKDANLETERQKGSIYDKPNIGDRIQIYWNGDKKWYQGEIIAFTPNEIGVDKDVAGKHMVRYDDGEVQFYTLAKKNYRIITPSTTISTKNKDETQSEPDIGLHEAYFKSKGNQKLQYVKGDLFYTIEPDQYDDLKFNKEWGRVLHKRQMYNTSNTYTYMVQYHNKGYGHNATSNDMYY